MKPQTAMLAHSLVEKTICKHGKRQMDDIFHDGNEFSLTDGWISCYS